MKYKNIDITIEDVSLFVPAKNLIQTDFQVSCRVQQLQKRLRESDYV